MSYPTITINGRELGVPKGYLTYGDVIYYIGGDPSVGYDVNYINAAGAQESGSLSPRQFINVCDATVITATRHL